jgi:hypothetical protein
MSSRLADIVGLIGSALFIAAFVYANLSPAMDKRMFNAGNLLGAMLLLCSLWINFNLAAFVLEVAWALIAFAGLVAALRHRPVAKP